LTTLAALISGIVGSKSPQLPSVATKIPDGAKPESRVKRLARWLDNERILEAMYFLPYAEIFLTHLALETLVLVMDGSVVGRGCAALMIHVISKGRALPLAWRVRQGPKGHFPEDLHIALVTQVHKLIPLGASVVLLGDGAKWIWDHVASVFDEGTIHIVDWFHAAEHLWTCAHAMHHEDSPALKAWVEPLKELLYNGNVREVLSRLRDQRSRTRRATHREAIDKLLTYLSNQDDRLAYDRFRTMGLDIGSGMVEAACKQVVAVRMKRNGMRWSIPGGQATLSLRVISLNQQWAAFWSTQPLRKAA